MDALQQQEIDLIILDLRMPGPVDGEQLLFTLRDQGNDVPVIVVSGWVDEEVTKQAPDCVHAVLKKPIRVDDFAQTVADVLSRRDAYPQSLSLLRPTRIVVPSHDSERVSPVF
jgi:DNA-binding NarL/FixJ family response regulator